MNNLYKNRLLLLADKLDQLPPGRFDYRRWVANDWDGSSKLESCGSMACALGWATTIPELQEAGLCLVKLNEYGTSTVCLQSELDDVLSEKISSTFCVDNACLEVFDLDDVETEYLFIPVSSHDTAREDDKYDDEGYALWCSNNYCAVEYGSESPDEHASAKEVSNHIRFFVEKKYGK